MEIIPMSISNVPAVAKLERRCFPDPWSEQSIASELSNPLSLWLVAVAHDGVVGYVGSQSVMEQADMMNIAVDPDYRRQGIAESLIGALTSALRERQVSSLSLEVRASNAPAMALYHKLGFLQVGKRPNYYWNPREDALILRKEW